MHYSVLNFHQNFSLFIAFFLHYGSRLEMDVFEFVRRLFPRAQGHKFIVSFMNTKRVLWCTEKPKHAHLHLFSVWCEEEDRRERQPYTSNKSTLRCFVRSSFKICNLIRARMKADQITTALCILYVTLPSTTGNHSTSSKSKPTGHGPGTWYSKPSKQAERLNDKKRIE